ncbi:MAG TPA: hypothetical protein VNH11_20900 [Pirellulales bacterium]|nr:hypothetical protein [Pirellulales bacterium]
MRIAAIATGRRGLMFPALAALLLLGGWAALAFVRAAPTQPGAARANQPPGAPPNVAVAAAAVTAPAAEATIASQPALELPDGPLDLGSGGPGDVLEGDFELRNPTDSPVDFALRATCGCTRLGPLVGVVGPHGAQKIEIATQLERRVGTARRVEITVTDKRRERRFGALLVVGECPSPLSLTPDEVSFSQVSRGEAASQQILVRTSEGGPLDARRLRFEIDSDCVDVRLDPSDPHECRLTVAVKRDAPLGYFNDALTLLLAEDESRPVRVVVQGEIVGAVVVSPAVLRLKHGAPRKRPLEHSFFVLRPGGRALGELIDVEAPRGVAVKAMPQPSARASVRRFSVAVPGSVATDFEIKLRFRDLPEPAVLTVKAAAESDVATSTEGIVRAAVP